MGLDICRGMVSGLEKPEEASKERASCKVGEQAVQLHPDLDRHINDGDEVIVAGSTDENGVFAMAMNNITQKKVTYVDASNFVLGIGFGGFIGFLCFVLSARYYMAGDGMMSSLNGLLCILGFVVMAWAISRVALVRVASRKVAYAPD